MDLKKKKKQVTRNTNVQLYFTKRKKKKRRIKTIFAIRQFTYYLQLETNFYVHMSNNPPRFDYVTRQMHQGCESEAAWNIFRDRSLPSTTPHRRRGWEKRAARAENNRLLITAMTNGSVGITKWRFNKVWDG